MLISKDEKNTFVIGASGKNSRHKILIIEDDPYIVQYYKSLLNESYDTVISPSGDVLKKPNFLDKVDLAIVDYRLPDISGIEVLKGIKKAKPSVPCLFVTGYGDEDAAVKAFRFGAKDYIKKPIQGDEILRKIDFHLSLKSGKNEKREALFFNDNPKVFHRIKNQDNYYKIQNAVKYINDSFMTKITLDATADKACLSRRHFSRLFKEINGVSFQEYINNNRIKKAIELLQKTDLTITEIAFFVGYNDLTNFERLFKRIAGTVPSQYRQACQK